MKTLQFGAVGSKQAQGQFARRLLIRSNAYRINYKIRSDNLQT